MQNRRLEVRCHHAHRQRDLEPRTLSDCARHVNFATVRFHNRRYKAKAEPQPFLWIGVRDAVESIENLRQVVRLDAYA